MLTSYEDMNERRRMEDALSERESFSAALQDPLTGLPNKLRLLDLIEQALGRLQRSDGYLFAVLAFNLDGFHRFFYSSGYGSFYDSDVDSGDFEFCYCYRSLYSDGLACDHALVRESG